MYKKLSIKLNHIYSPDNLLTRCKYMYKAQDDILLPVSTIKRVLPVPEPTQPQQTSSQLIDQVLLNLNKLSQTILYKKNARSFEKEMVCDAL